MKIRVHSELHMGPCGVIIEDTLSMFKEFISSQTVRKNYFPPDDNLESDWLVFGIEDSIMGR